MSDFRNTIHVIHLSHREDRLSNFETQSAVQKFNYVLWSGLTTSKQPCTNISNAHKQIVQKAKLKNWPYVTIAEDDCTFTAVGAWNYYLLKMPLDFDLYCGLLYHGEVDKNNKVTKGMSGSNTLYTIKENFYDFFLMTDNSKHLDRELGKFANINTYIICNPMVCVQMGGYSDNHKRSLSYEAYLEGKKLFGQ